MVARWLLTGVACCVALQFGALALAFFVVTVKHVAPALLSGTRTDPVTAEEITKHMEARPSVGVQSRSKLVQSPSDLPPAEQQAESTEAPAPPDRGVPDTTLDRHQNFKSSKDEFRHLNGSILLRRPVAATGTKLKVHKARKGELNLQKTPDLFFYGDSIMEQWREEYKGRSKPEAAGNRQTFHRIFYNKFGTIDIRSAIVLAVAGDTTDELLWRLQNGEAPRQNPKAIVLHIGINDLGKMGAYCYVSGRRRCPNPRPEQDFGIADAQKAFEGVRAIIQELMARCSTPILVAALFPTGPHWPGGAFGRTVPPLNAMLAGYVERSPGTLYWADCTFAVLSTTGDRIDNEAMPDFIHPAPEAMTKWAHCLARSLQTMFMQRAQL